MNFHTTDNPDLVIGETDVRPSEMFPPSVIDMPIMARHGKLFLLWERNRPMSIAQAIIYLDRQGETWLEYLVVDPRFQRHGYAAWLFAWLEARFGTLSYDPATEDGAAFVATIQGDEEETGRRVLPGGARR